MSGVLTVYYEPPASPGQRARDANSAGGAFAAIGALVSNLIGDWGHIMAEVTMKSGKRYPLDFMPTTVGGPAIAADVNAARRRQFSGILNFTITDWQAEAARAYILRKSVDPGVYSVYSNDCVTTTATVLLVAHILPIAADELRRLTTPRELWARIYAYVDDYRFRPVAPHDSPAANQTLSDPNIVSSSPTPSPRGTDNRGLLVHGEPAWVTRSVGPPAR